MGLNVIEGRLVELPAIGAIELRDPEPLTTSATPASSRIAYSAAHVVADPLRSGAGTPTAVDWDATLAIRHRLWDLGLGIAESMDTAQRGMGLSPAAALELGRRTIAEGRARGGRVAVGIATDHLEAGSHSLEAISRAYREQLHDIEGAGGSAVMMASRQLAASARDAEDYRAVYAEVLAEAQRPVVLHWLGDMFDPALRGYWGSADLDLAAETVLAIIEENRDRISGIKMSLLNADREIALRRRLPAGVEMYTGDDFNYVDLIAGDEQGHSNALLGAFSAVPRFASAALLRLDAGDVEGYRSILLPTQEMGRLVFEAPTLYYKVGVAWLSFLNGWQPAFRMVAGFEGGRSIEHLARIFELANRIGLFEDPDAAAAKAVGYFRGVGVL